MITSLGIQSALAVAEVGDAPSLPPGQAPVGTGALTTISGATSFTDREDLYRICITGNSFSATTVGGAAFDTQLFLFTDDGMGVATGKVANDDSAGTFQSTLPSGPTTFTNGGTLSYAPGPYFLAISGFDNDPRDASNQEIFPDFPFTGVYHPIAGRGPLKNWSGGGAFGSYTITLTGATFIGQAPCVTGADLSVAKTDSPDPVLVGEALTYTVTVTNAGPSAATGVTLTDTLPMSVTFVSATPSQSGPCTQAGVTVTCPLGTIANGGSATVTIQVIPTAKGTITNSATVGSATFDPDTANNGDSEDTVVLALDGGAFGEKVAVTTPLLGLPITSGPLPSVTMPPGGGGPFSASLASISTSPLSARVLAVDTQGGRDAGGDIFVASSADVARASLAGGLISARAVHSDCRAETGTGSFSSSRLASLVIVGIPVNVNVPPNTAITIPLVGTLFVNEQTTTMTGPNQTRIVNALRLNLNGLLGTGDVIVAQSRCIIDP